MSQALFAHNNPTYNEDDAIPWQAAQVSAISVMNCLGRIVIGWRHVVLPATGITTDLNM